MNFHTPIGNKRKDHFPKLQPKICAGDPLPGTCTDYIVNHYSSSASALLYHVLQASTLGMVPPKYAWITYVMPTETFWMQSPSNRTTYQVFDQCSREQMMSILNQMITIRNDPRYDERDKGKPIVGNVVSLRIWQ